MPDNWGAVPPSHQIELLAELDTVLQEEGLPIISEILYMRRMMQALAPLIRQAKHAVPWRINQSRYQPVVPVYLLLHDRWMRFHRSAVTRAWPNIWAISVRHTRTRSRRAPPHT